MKNPFSSKKADSRSLMTNARLDVLIRELSDKVEGQLGYWQFTISQLSLIHISEPTRPY